MHPAVDLLLKRMESNPDEFVQGHPRHPRWERIIERYKEFLDSEDKKLLKEKYTTLQMDQMHKEIMAELLHGEEDPLSATLRNHPQFSLPFSPTTKGPLFK